MRPTSSDRARFRIRKYILEYKATHPCVDCGEADPVVLEFDHRNPAEKCFNISGAVAWIRTLDALEREIAKCEVRCANCRRRKTKASGDIKRRFPAKRRTAGGEKRGRISVLDANVPLVVSKFMYSCVSGKKPHYK